MTFNIEIEGRKVYVSSYEGPLNVVAGNLEMETHQARQLAAALASATSFTVEEIADED